MTIPKFNNGDSLKAIREDSLNPLIDAMNTLQTLLADSSFLDKGVAKGTGSISGLGEGMWVVEAGSVITGRPPASAGDLLVNKQIVTGPNKARYGFLIVMGLGTDGKEHMWVRFKVTGSWGSWLEFATKDTFTSLISPVTKKVQELILSVNQANDGYQRVTNAQTAIERQLSALENAPKPPTLEEVKAALISQGWGPLPAHGGGGHPQPATHPAIYADFGTAIPRVLPQTTSTTGTLTLTRTGTSRSRLIVLVLNDQGQADRVTGIKVDGGMAAVWPSQDVTIDGKDYKLYYSSGAYSETSFTIQVVFA